ncbi:TolC family protein [Brucepastera parasyntrophica]|uniref:TolC family protein n=1 Tax=Brucepastera parasyntrophica TaxID=2880008 RepID=UPI00210F171B|nr:TolC family protein [Brucepastera parasyntrophica]ULQ60302.1 TolC family protein [Brucepastera parasyntrophica]
MKQIISVILCVCAGMGCFAGEILTLEDARTLALANSKSLSRYNLATEIALLDERSQMYSNLPSLSLGISGSATLWGGDEFTDSLSAGASVGLNQTIWSGGKNSVLSAINKISTEITRQDAIAEYFNVLDSVDSSYYGILQSRASLDAAAAALDTAALGLSIAEIRYEGGVISPGDYLQAVAEHESKKTAQNQAKRDLALSIAKLRSVTGLSSIPDLESIDFENYETLIQGLSVLSDDETDTLFAALWTKLRTANPGLAKAALQTEKSDKSVSLAKKDYFPSLSAGISTGLNYSYTNGFETSSGKLTISGNIPLDFWVTSTSVNSKKLALEQSLLDYSSAESSLDLEVRTGLLDCIAQASSVISSRKAAEYAQKHFENQLELYKLAQASVSELSDAAALLSSNQTQLIKAQYGFLSCLSVIRSLGAFESEDQVILFLLPVSQR